MQFKLEFNVLVNKIFRMYSLLIHNFVHIIQHNEIVILNAYSRSLKKGW